MTGLDRLKAAFEAFAARQATPEQDTVVREAIAAGQVQVLSGERAIQFGRDANGATVVSGDRNLVISVAPGEIAALLKALATDRCGVDHLPADLGDFVGREKEIERLTAILTAGGGQAAVSAIGGMGGIGKSALAVHVAHRLADEAPDGRLFVDLGGRTGTPFAAVGTTQPSAPLAPVEAMLKVVALLEPGRQVPREDDAARQAYRTALDGRRVLLLLDNAESSAQVRPLLDWRAPTFDTRPVDFIHGAEIIGIGVALFFILELEKWLRRWLTDQGSVAGERTSDIHRAGTFAGRRQR